MSSVDVGLQSMHTRCVWIPNALYVSLMQLAMEQKMLSQSRSTIPCTTQHTSTQLWHAKVIFNPEFLDMKKLSFLISRNLGLNITFVCHTYSAELNWTVELSR
jgi:hypothetical protein